MYDPYGKSRPLLKFVMVHFKVWMMWPYMYMNGDQETFQMELSAIKSNLTSKSSAVYEYKEQREK